MLRMAQARKPLNTKKDYVSSRGFTLLQTLFVIVIIAILGSVVIASTSSARVKGRDSKRLSDLNQMKVALELYREAEGHYPYRCSSGQAYSITSFDNAEYYEPMKLCSVANGNASTQGIGTLTTVMSTPPNVYVSKLSDPKNIGQDSGYLYINNGGKANYCFMIYRTVEDLRNFPASTINPRRCGGYDANGQCNVAGPDGMSNTIYIGKGTYASTGC